MSTISASTTSTTGYVVTSDTTGTLVFKTGASPTTALTIGSDQSVTYANQPTYSGGTANGVAYLNGSKVLTTGTALTFDGTSLGIGTATTLLNAGGGTSTKISANTGTGFAAQNINTGTASYTVYQLGNNNSTNRAGFALLGSAYTTSGIYKQDGVYLYTNGAGGMTISCESAQPIYFVTNNSLRGQFDANGNLLVNTTTITSAGISTTNTLQVKNEAMSTGTQGGWFWENRSGGVTSNSNWYGWYTTGGTIYLYNGSANIASINTSTGAYTALSDINKKKDFEDSNIGLATVMQLQPKLFRMLDDADDSPKQLGFIAQDVEQVLPQAYVESTMVDAGKKESTYIGLQDRPIIAALTKAIQEQQAIIETLTNRITALEAK